jgi:glycosyltransferase involved in cell wall biosynthesis
LTREGSSGVSFHRIEEPLRVLREQGYTAIVSDRLDDEHLAQVDTVLVSMLHEEQMTEAWHQLAKLDTHRLVIDVDDWMWDPDIDALKKGWPKEALDRLFSNVRRAHVVTTTSSILASYLLKYNNNVWVLPNTMPAWALDVPKPGRDQGLWLGYQGALNRWHDWRPQVVGIAKFLRDNPDWGMGWIGDMRLGDFEGYRTWRTPWTADKREYYAKVAAFTVGLGPLRKTMFNLAKSGLRAVEYAALGVVPVLPDLDPYRPFVKSGYNGMLIRPHETTRGILQDLANDLGWVERMAAQAREDAKRWTTEAAIEAWAEAWNSV